MKKILVVINDVVDYLIPFSIYFSLSLLVAQSVFG